MRRAVFGAVLALAISAVAGRANHPRQPPQTKAPHRRLLGDAHERTPTSPSIAPPGRVRGRPSRRPGGSSSRATAPQSGRPHVDARPAANCVPVRWPRRLDGCTTISGRSTSRPTHGGVRPGGRGPRRFGHEAVWVDGVGLVVGRPGRPNRSSTTSGRTTRWQTTGRASRMTGRNPSPAMARARPSAPTGGCGSATALPRTASGSPTPAYDFDAGRWTDETPDGKQPVVRCLHACWLTADGRFALYAGQTTGVRALGDLWALNEVMGHGRRPAPAGAQSACRRAMATTRSCSAGSGSTAAISATSIASTERRSFESCGRTAPGRPHVPARHSSTTPATAGSCSSAAPPGDAFADTWQLTLP